jgi:integrase
MRYYAFRKPRKLKNGKTVRRWYYYYIDETGKQVQKSCGTKVKSRAAAEDYISALSSSAYSASIVHADFNSKTRYKTASKIQHTPRLRNPDILIKDIAENMFLPGSLHMKRRQQLKKSISAEIVESGRNFIKQIINMWGNRMLRTLELEEVMSYLFSVDRSGSWKNQYIYVINEIYLESQFLGCKIFKPNFPSIGRVYNKADIFTETELERFFKPDNFPHDFFLLFFLCSLSGGLRLGETRALRAKQIIFEKKAVIVDGFLKSDDTRTTYNKRGSPDHPKLRVVPYPDFTLELLKNHIEKSSINPEDYLFTFGGRPITKSKAERAFTVALIKCGIAYDVETLKKKNYWQNGHIVIKSDLIPDGRRLIPHSLRYTYITRMSLDMDAHNLKKVTGHNSTSMIDYYNRKNLEMALKAIPGADVATASLLPAAIKKAF